MIHKVARIGLMLFLAFLVSLPLPLLAQSDTPQTKSDTPQTKEDKDKAKAKSKGGDTSKGTLEFARFCFSSVLAERGTTQLACAAQSATSALAPGAAVTSWTIRSSARSNSCPE